MLKHKASVQSPYEGEQREQKLYFQVFGEDQFQNEAEFELDAIRNNFNKPLEMIMDHMKDESIKKVFQQMSSRKN